MPQAYAGGSPMEAFMRAFQETSAQLQQQNLLAQQQAIQGEDRKRQIERQTLADTRGEEDRQRAIALQKLQITPTLAELGSTADDPQGAQRIIETVIPGLMQAFGQDTMAFGMPAVEMATRTITARQKKQVSEYVEKALRSSFVADHPDADPDVSPLPEHIQKAIGKSSAKLSELQQFAELPVGKPQGKTRVPAMPGSFEDYIHRKYGDAPTPEQIIEGRKLYTDAGREPDKPNPNAGAYPPATQRRIDAIVRGFDSQPIVKKTQTMAEAVSFSEGLNPNTTNPADDQALIYAFAKAMDPDSVVREGEYATVQKYSQSWADRFGFDVKRIFSNTQFLTPESRQNMKATIKAKFESGRGQYENLRREYGRKIERITRTPGGADELTDFGAAFPMSGAAPSSGPKIGDTVRNKTTGALSEVTAIRPDGSLVLKPK